MDIREAANLIDFDAGHGLQLWADLGCGSGTFTFALATKLSAQSSIYAVDIDSQILSSTYGQVSIEFIQSDFVNGLCQLPALHGVLMANSLHYEKDKETLLSLIKCKMLPGAKLVIVEYETSHGNNWVPYPIPFADLKMLATQLGFSLVTKLGEMPSRYQGSMYAALMLNN